MTDDERNLGAVNRLAAEFCKLPGIGPKTAERLTYFLLAGDRRAALGLAEALRGVVEAVHPCAECFNLAEGPLCSVFAKPQQLDPSAICHVQVYAARRAAPHSGQPA